MTAPVVTGLYVYPIKSLGGVAVPRAEVTDRGLALDRRFMLVDGEGRFVTQRAVPRMAALRVAVTASRLTVSAPGAAPLEVPRRPDGPRRPVSVWSSAGVPAVAVGPEADAWFSEALGVPVSLVYMPEDAERPVSPKHARAGEIVSFADGYPFLMISEASLDGLNARLAEPVPMARFRPNIVVSGCAPHAEDAWRAFELSGVRFFGVKPCSRCIITCTDQETGARTKEPLRTLSMYRRVGAKVLFGQNLLHEGHGWVNVGDPLRIYEVDPRGPPA